jgi:hypothetical protein
MWSCLKLNNRQFADLVVLINTFKTDKQKFTAIDQSGTNVLVLYKTTKKGKHHVMFSPKSLEILSDIDSRYLEFNPSFVEHPKKIGSIDGFVYLFGNRTFYDFVKSKSQRSLI